jgi:hypothetical protein
MSMYILHVCLCCWPLLLSLPLLLPPAPRELATGLADCLAAKGMLDSPEGMALLLHTSSSIVDSLPRAGEAGKEGRL